MDSWLSLSHHFYSFTVATMTWLTITEYLCHKWPRICSTCRRHFLVLSLLWLITGIVTGVTRSVSLVEQELLTLPESLNSPPVFSGVSVARSFCVAFCRSLFVLFLLTIVLYVLQFTDSDYPFGIFKFLYEKSEGEIKKTLHNPETLTTVGTQGTGRRQIKTQKHNTEN